MTPDKTEASMASAVPPAGSAAAADGTAPPDGTAVTGEGAVAGGSGPGVAGQGGPAGRTPAGGTMHAMRRRGTSLLQRYSLVALLGISIGVYGIWGKTSAVFLTAAVPGGAHGRQVDQRKRQRPSSTLLSMETCLPRLRGSSYSRAGMTPEQIANVRPRLLAFAGEMLGGLARRDQRAAGELYVRGLLTDGRRKAGAADGGAAG